jgi:hypothetical protein
MSGFCVFFYFASTAYANLMPSFNEKHGDGIEGCSWYQRLPMPSKKPSKNAASTCFLLPDAASQKSEKP